MRPIWQLQLALAAWRASPIPLQEVAVLTDRAAIYDAGYLDLSRMKPATSAISASAVGSRPHAILREIGRP